MSVKRDKILQSMGLGRIIVVIDDCFQNVFHGAIDLSNRIQENQIIPVDDPPPAHPKFIHIHQEMGNLKNLYSKICRMRSKRIHKSDQSMKIR